MKRLHRIASIVVFALAALCGASQAQEAERFLTYKVPRIDKKDAPTVDGALDEDVWKGRAAIDTLRIFLGKGAGDFARQKSEFVVLSDGDNLYIGATFHEENMKGIRANPATSAFGNDCIEVYFDPRHDGTRHIQLVVSCIGQTYHSRQVDEGFGWYADSAWRMLADWESAVKRGKSSWTVELRIGAKSFGIDTSPGSVVGANLCRFRFAGGDEFTAWTFGPRIRKLQKDMASWGHLIFSDKPTVIQEVTMAEVKAVYPELGRRVLQVPAEGGFRLFSTEGVNKVSYRELLAPMVGRIRTAAAEASGAMTELDDAKAPDARLAGRLADLQADLDKRIAETKTDTLTQGAFDRAADELTGLERQIVELTWQARLKRLVHRAQSNKDN